MNGCRSTRKQFFVYHSENVLGWRMIRMTDMARGDAQVMAGNWRRVYETLTGMLIGFQVVQASTARGEYDMPSIPTPAAMSAREMELNCARSRTAGLSEDQRAELRFPEDKIERVQAKVRVYAQIGAARGDILRVWPR